MENLYAGIKGIAYILAGVFLFYGGFALIAFRLVFAPTVTIFITAIAFVWLCGAFFRWTGRLIARGNDHLNKN